MEPTIFGGELLAPLLETSLIGGLTAVAIAYEHYNTTRKEGKLHPLVSNTKPEKNPRFMIPAIIFFINEFLLLAGYVLSTVAGYFFGTSFWNGLASWIIYSSCILFLIGIGLLIRDIIPVLTFMNNLAKVK